MYRSAYDKKIKGGYEAKPGHDWESMTKSPRWTLVFIADLLLIAGLIFLVIWTLKGLSP